MNIKHHDQTDELCPYEHLVAALIRVRLADLRSEQTHLYRQAQMWFGSADAEWWCAWLGLTPAQVLALDDRYQQTTKRGRHGPRRV